MEALFQLSMGIAVGIALGALFTGALRFFLRLPASPSKPASRSEPSKPSDYPTGGEGF